MDEYYTRSHVPAFGSWDWNNDLPFTKSFESDRQAELLRYTHSEDRDLYVAGDLYDNVLVTPAMIIVSRAREMSSPSPIHDLKLKEKSSPSPMQRPTSKPVDEDLYKISPHLLYAKPRKKRALSFFSSCIVPTCVL